ncbi:hypothetical protein DM02DRAFT_728584 [Periconia macrospinosa]|uniref:Uncharacterized protein n=1 Tax=Periconia macrospinosa TaxID=97972 RepID=A0A2V1DSR1_9PLEO|nr:hypothetical protein DM02DRAFT_728584 [Periconia macrospinosa]
MQNYGQQPPAGYHRPGSTNSFANAPAPPPPQYGAPQAQNQWAAPAQNQTQNQGQQWGQAQQAGGYNPNVYGAMPGGYSQAQATPAHTAPSYPPQQDMPPPPPPKPTGFAAAVAQQQTSHNYGQQPAYGAQPPPQNTGYAQGIENYTSQGGYQAQAAPQQPYNSAAPPPPSQTPGGSYFPPSQGPPVPARPESIYGVGHPGISSTPAAAGSQPPQNQPYTQASTVPISGAYAPPSSDVPAWQSAQQQTQQPPIQGSGTYDYTRPGAESNTYPQGYQANTPTQQGQYGQMAQNQYPHQTPIQQQGQYGQQGNSQYPPQQHIQYNQNAQPAQNQTTQLPGQYPQQTPQPYNQVPPQSQTPQQSSQPPSQWAPPQSQTPQQSSSQPSQWAPPASQAYGQQPVQQPVQQPAQQQGWQQGYQSQGPYSNQQQYQGQNAGIQAPKPVSGHTGTTPPGFVNETSPQSQPVSPLAHQQTMSFGSVQTQSGLGRADSISSIALGGVQGVKKTETPKPAAVNALPARDDPSQFSALGLGGPSDWEHFGAEGDIDDEELLGAKKEHEAPGSVELPAQLPSSSVQSDFPSPPDQPLPLNVQRHDDYPTPDFSGRGTPTQPPRQQQVAQQQSFVMDDGGWAASSVPTQQPAHSYTSTEPYQDHVAHGINQGAPSHGHDTQMQQANEELRKANEELKDALKTKTDAYEALVKDVEKQKTDSRREVDELNVILATVRKHAETERNSSEEQLKALKATVEQSKSERDALLKDKEIEIERWKEDAEGKDNSVKEKESVIAELNKQLKERNSTIEELKKELETEKSKVPPKPTAADLVPDIDPWYAGSLERYIVMLRGEANEGLVEDKIKTFTAFMKAESGIRGLEYYNAPPPAPAVQEPTQHNVEQPTSVDKKPTAAPKHERKDLNVQVPQQPQSAEEDIQYSPGGRPMILRQTTIPFPENASAQSSANQLGTILTPTSSQDDDFNKNTTGMQSLPEQQPQPQYKAYVPPGVTQADSAQLLRRQSMPFTNVAPVAPLKAATPGTGDEIFFRGPASQTSSRPSSRPTVGTPSENTLPPPLSTPKPSNISTPTPTDKRDPLYILKSLLPAKISPSKPSPQLEKVRQKMNNVSSDTTFIATLTSSWEKTAEETRKKNSEARHKREGESEANTDQLFNDHEISYADIGAIEDEFKEKERVLKAQEDRAEYDSYDQSVFSEVYSTFQEQIKTLTDIYIDAESLLQTSVSGVKALEGGDSPTTKESLKLLRDVNAQIELRHENVVLAVVERDKRYKKTEIQPLYAAGNIAKMKAVEKHFENAEKQGVARAKIEKAQRLREFNTIVTEIVVEAIGVEQGEIEGIVEALRNISPSEGEPEIVSRANETIAALKSSTKSLLAHLHAFDVDLNNCDSEAAIAKARASNATANEIAELEKEKTKNEKELKDEFDRKVKVVDQDDGLGAGIVGEKKGTSGGTSGMPMAPLSPPVGQDEGLVRNSEEEEKRKRLEKALEAAKRRNGDL